MNGIFFILPSKKILIFFVNLVNTVFVVVIMDVQSMMTTTKTVLTKDPTGKSFYNYSSLKPPNHLKAILAFIFIGCT
jgi:hypothetical protein